MVVGGALSLDAEHHAAAQEEPGVEVITEPPSEPEAPPAEPPPSEPEAPAAELGKPAPRKEPPGHLRVGGGLGFGFATGFVSVGVSPQVSYIFKRIVEPGVAFLLVEGEIINAGFRQGDFRSGRTNYGNLLLGGGFLLGVGRGAFVATSLKFAVFRNPYYPDAFPIISVGAGYAF